MRNSTAGVRNAKTLKILSLTSASPADILEHYKRAQNPVLFFLDIGLGADMNGIELAGKIREQNKKAFIVFLTTHSEMTHLTFQYKVEALDFIVKNISNDALKKRIGDCIETAIARHISTDKTRTVQIKADDKIILLDMDEILYIETSDIRNKLRLHTKSRRLEFNGELKKIEAELDERFFRCHKSYVVNNDKIASIDKKNNVITIENNDTLPISRSGKKLLL